MVKKEEKKKGSLKERFKKDKLKKEKWRKINKFFRLKKSKLIIFLSVIGIGVLFQIWEFFNSQCLKIFCEPIILGVIYYLIWPFQLLNILIFGIFQINRIFLSLAKIIFIVMQVFYWYVLACALSIPINYIRGKIGKKKRRNADLREKAVREGIKRDLKRADELEIEKIKKTANRF